MSITSRRAGLAESGTEEVVTQDDPEQPEGPLGRSLLQTVLDLQAADRREEVALSVRLLREDLLLETEEDRLEVDEHD